ncbi:hypothetical protein K3495_g2092 [Podosphaera aphanis]|nr:hypothetical protein K3495_g2092 [Podosphaera aphanis]
MSTPDDNRSVNGFDPIEEQLCYVYTPRIRHTSVCPRKSQEVEDPFNSHNLAKGIEKFEFEPLFNRIENSDCRKFRKKLYEQSWAATDTRIKDILNAANEKSVEDIIGFLYASAQLESTQIPTGFVTTGPNFASQELIFRQILNRLKPDTKNPVVTIRSADATNLKSVLKQIIRDAVTPIIDDDDNKAPILSEDGRKLLSYDLKILQNFVETYSTAVVTIVVQDSEAFDTSLLAELVSLFSSWRDRIPFHLIIGIGTSLELFYDRIPRAASRCLSGRLFEVEQTSSLLERIFLQAVAGATAPLRLSPDLIRALLEWLEDHPLGIQDFVSALKYAYMCHYYFDALSVFNVTQEFSYLSKIIQKEHLEAIRMLPSFRDSVEREISHGNSTERLFRVRSLLTDDRFLLDEIGGLIASKKTNIIHLLRAIHILTNASSEPLSKIHVYLIAANGCLRGSKAVQHLLDSIKRITARDLIAFIDKIRDSIYAGAPEMGLASWDENESELLAELIDIQSQVSTLEEICSKNGTNLKSSYEIHHKSLRTRVVAQRIQLSHENTLLSDEDKKFTAQIDRLSQLFGSYFSISSPHTDPLSEVWTFDSLQHLREVFTPRPRAALERALASPSDYLCSISTDKLSAKQPVTATLYQMYLESGSLINVFDLWSAFSNALKSADQVAFNERDALVLFYRALADLKMIGLVKQSKRKIDHLSKLAWKGL